VNIFLGIGQAQISLKVARGQHAEFPELFQGGPRFLPVLGGSILFGLAVFAGFALCIVPGIMLCLMFWPFYYVLVEGRTQIMDSFTMAREITRGNALTTFVLWLCSAGIMILGFLALCVGIFLAAPLVSVIWATAYLMMSGQLPAGPGAGPPGKI
jgi:hypothetical protein